MTKAEVRVKSGLSDDQTMILMREHGHCDVNHRWTLPEGVYKELMEDGYIRRLKQEKWDALAEENDNYRNRIHNLTLYIRYLHEYRPDVFAEMMEYFDGMPGYSEVLNG